MPLEQTTLDLFRLALKGDTASVRRLGRRLLKDLSVSSEVRAGLAKLMAEAPAAPSLRWASPEQLREDTFATTLDPDPAVEAPVLPPQVQAEIDQLVAERERAHELHALGIVPTRTVLLTGSPGVGKTLTARFIAARLGLPLLRVDLSGLMSSYLGKTGQNLRAMLSNARTSPSVLLLDEFDAIAKRRDDPADVGELKRIVNVLLLELEEWPSTGLLVAATNHPELLDRAIWRRFEKIISIPLPTAQGRRILLDRQLRAHNTTVASEILDTLVEATDGSSASDLVTLVRGAVRRAVLQPRACHEVLLESVLDQLLLRAPIDTPARALFCRVSHDHFGATQREIAARLGVSHVSVGKILRSTPPRATSSRLARPA